MPPRQAFAQHMPMAPKAMIRLLFRHAAARRFSVRSVAEDSCFGYARFHFIQYNRTPPFLFHGFSKRPANRRLLIQGAR